MFKSINDISFFKDAGIATDITAFFKEAKNIASYKFSADDEKYLIEITLIDNSKNAIEDAFYSFVRYIKYSHIVCYQKHIIDDLVTYDFITADELMEGFFCCVSIR